MAYRTIIALALGSLLAVEPVQSQSTINCLPEYSWMDNSLKQNPCLLADLAWGACGDPTDNFLDPLGTPAEAAGFYYPGPDASEVSSCICNTITYSFFSACSICQNGTSDTWLNFKKNCTGGVAIGISTYPLPIPENSAFPAWAYLNVTGGFNEAAAQADSSGIESKPVPTSTSTSSTSTSTSTVTVTNSTPGPSIPVASNPSSATHKSSNTGAIAGGTVGGLVFLAALAGLAVYLLRRRGQSHTAPSDAYYGVPQKTPPSMSDRSFAQQQQPIYRPYDPSDPSTFPETAPTPTIQTTSSGYAHQQPGAYRGVAEV